MFRHAALCCVVVLNAGVPSCSRQSTVAHQESTELTRHVGPPAFVAAPKACIPSRRVVLPLRRSSCSTFSEARAASHADANRLKPRKRLVVAHHIAGSGDAALWLTRSAVFPWTDSSHSAEAWFLETQEAEEGPDCRQRKVIGRRAGVALGVQIIKECNNRLPIESLQSKIRRKFADPRMCELHEKREL